MKKDFKVEIKETLTKTMYVSAESIEDAEDIIREKYYNEDIVLDSENFDGVEFDVEKTDPRNMNYLMYKGFSFINAYYISEMFSTLNRLNINDYNDRIEEIVNCADDMEFIGKYDEKYFNTYLTDICGYEFSHLKPSEFDNENKFYKTIDDKYIMEFQV